MDARCCLASASRNASNRNELASMTRPFTGPLRCRTTPVALTSVTVSAPENDEHDCCVTDIVPVNVARDGACTIALYRQFPITSRALSHAAVGDEQALRNATAGTKPSARMLTDFTTPCQSKYVPP